MSVPRPIKITLHADVFRPGYQQSVAHQQEVWDAIDTAAPFAPIELEIIGDTEREIPPPHIISSWWEEYIGPWRQVTVLSRRALAPEVQA